MSCGNNTSKLERHSMKHLLQLQFGLLLTVGNASILDLKKNFTIRAAFFNLVRHSSVICLKPVCNFNRGMRS